jgi:hypothetical protein
MLPLKRSPLPMLKMLMLIKAAFHTGVLLFQKTESCAICQMKAIEVLMLIGNGRIDTSTSICQHFLSPISYDEF